VKLSEVPGPRITRGFECAMGAVWPLLDDDDRAALAGWLADRTISDRWVGEQISAATGARINYQMVARHRRGDCDKCRDAGRIWT